MGGPWEALRFRGRDITVQFSRRSTSRMLSGGNWLTIRLDGATKGAGCHMISANIGSVSLRKVMRSEKATAVGGAFFFGSRNPQDVGLMIHLIHET